MHHDFLFHVSYTLTWWTNENWARYCTEFEDHIILRTQEARKDCFSVPSSHLCLLYHHHISYHLSSRLPLSSLSFARFFSLGNLSLPFLGSFLSLRGRHGEADHYRSLPSSRGWDGLRDWSMTKSFGVGWYLTYAGKRDDRCSNDGWFFEIRNTSIFFNSIFHEFFVFQFHFG